MKILYHQRTQSEDGQSVHIRSLIGAFRSLGHEVREVALVVKSDGGEPEVAGAAEPKDGWALMKYVPQVAREIAEYAYSGPAARKLVRAHREFGADVIYERYAFGNRGGIRAAKKTGLPIILEVNAPMAFELTRDRGLSFPRMARRVEDEIFRGATRVAVVTQVLGDMLLEYGVEKERLLVTPNGVHWDHFQNLDADAARANLGLGDAEGPVLGFVGYYREWHGLDKVVAGLASNGLRDARLVLVGYGPAEASLREAAQKHGVTDRVHFAGPRKHSEVPGILSAFDVGLVPAINPYASPLKLQEYMAAGIASVVPDQPNLREVVTDGHDALLFTPNDHVTLIERLVTLAQDAPLRARLGAAARQTVIDRELTWEGTARRIVDVAKEL